jgi:hypothetical protein
LTGSAAARPQNSSWHCIDGTDTVKGREWRKYVCNRALPHRTVTKKVDGELGPANDPLGSTIAVIWSDFCGVSPSTLNFEAVFT